jgi:hypothetical protein
MDLLKDSIIWHKLTYLLIHHWKLAILVIITGSIATIFIKEDDKFISINNIKGIIKK